MACMHRVSQKPDLAGLRLIGFDSFEGLPDEAALTDEGPWLPGPERIQSAVLAPSLSR